MPSSESSSVEQAENSDAEAVKAYSNRMGKEKYEENDDVRTGLLAGCRDFHFPCQ